MRSFIETAKIGKTTDELYREKRARACEVFTLTQVHNWEGAARRHAEEGKFTPPTMEDLALAIDVYTDAWSRRRYKISREKRDEADAAQP